MNFKLLFFLFAGAIASAFFGPKINVAVAPRAYVSSAELRGGTNYVYWRSVGSNTPAFTILNLTNSASEPKKAHGTNILVWYSAPGTIETSTDIFNWSVATVVWTNSFGWRADEPKRFFRVPAIPSIHPSNGFIVSP